MRCVPLAVQSLCKYVEPGLVPAVQLLHRAEARLLSSITHEQYQHGDKQHEQQQQQKKQQQQHAGVVTPEEEAIAIRIMLAWLQHSLPGSSSSSSSSSSTLSQKTCSPAGDAADADADAAAAAAQGRQQRHCSGDAAPDLVASLVSQLRQEWQEEQKAGGMADAVRPYLATVRQPGARIDLRDLRALTLAGQRGGAPPGSDWAAALEAAEQGDQDMHDVRHGGSVPGRLRCLHRSMLLGASFRAWAVRLKTCAAAPLPGGPDPAWSASLKLRYLNTRTPHQHLLRMQAPAAHAATYCPVVALLAALRPGHARPSSTVINLHDCYPSSTQVLSSAVMGTLITGQYKPQGRCGQPPCADLLTSAAVPLVLSIAQVWLRPTLHARCRIKMTLKEALNNLRAQRVCVSPFGTSLANEYMTACMPVANAERSAVR